MNIPAEAQADLDAKWDEVWAEALNSNPALQALSPERLAEHERQAKEQFVGVAIGTAQACAKAHKEACDECAKLVDAFIKAQVSNLSGPMALKLQGLAAGMREVGSALDEEFGLAAEVGP